ncbi:rhomboid family intramembrane serine protease [Halorussus amylolyticus]|uniref:rhomboid family intramembrane serine protease n=1 Tax=Halorussus amylolyticus TaxID=1126242 RepID=UPI00104E0717|nr:rhomboid family intramembrane serine protease [Halorussus amylolyticus]
MLDVPSWLPAPVQVAIPLVFLLSLSLVWRIDRPRGEWGLRLRRRFLLGVPWGTLVSILGVLAVYLFVQQGAQRWHWPLTLPFSSWSYFYPTGWFFAAFSHGGSGHLVGNLTTTVAVAPLAEYYFGHFGGERGDNPFSSWTTHPWIRAFVVFPVGVFAVGLATSLLAWGPVIGFSGVVFAFVGFALVRYPLLTVIAVAGQEVIRTVYDVMRNPVVFGSAEPSFSDPWWYGVAVQGHALGLFLGLLLGVVVLYRRRERPDALRLWTGAVLLGTSMTLWAVWWYRGDESYVLYQGLGIVFVVAVAAMTTVAATADREIAFGNVSRQVVGFLVLAAPLAVMAGVAIPVNLTTVDDASVPGDGPGIEVEGYAVTYAENIENQKVSVVDIEAFGETTNVRTSGVIVVNDDREIWTQQVSKGRLAFSGRAAVRVGGVGWSEVVRVQRGGWSAADGGTAYQVWLRGPDDERWTPTYASDPVTAGPTLAEKNVSIVPENGGFDLRLSRNNSTVSTAPIPADGERVILDGIRFERDGNRVFAAFDGTRVRVASKETYN